IGITDGKIASISKSDVAVAEVELDAESNLVTESFVNPHLHLDKVFTLDRLDELALEKYHQNQMTAAAAAIELASRVKTQYDRSWIMENVRIALRWAAVHGNTHIRAFADVDNKAKLEGVVALLELREEFRNIVDIQVVAFPQDGVVKEPGADILVHEAMSMGADVVGGIPWIEHSDVDAQSHIDAMFSVATQFDAPVSMLVDDVGDAKLRTLEMLAMTTKKVGWEGRVLAHHARAMALYPDSYHSDLVKLLKDSNIGIVTDPHTGPLHVRVKDLLEKEVLVCLGQDDISDAYYPYGQNNMLEVAFLASHLLWMTTKVDMDCLYDMITTSAAKAMGLTTHKLEVGSTASLVVLDVPTTIESLRFHRAPKYVINHGRIIAESGELVQ
ncbi:MAG: amidohydrolase family protein, partial [Chloroflexota bacterium]|nr:amidohydrolase family protein [Chloroflexota bacterium]